MWAKLNGRPPGAIFPRVINDVRRDSYSKPMDSEQLACIEKLYHEHHEFLLAFLQRMDVEGMDVSDIAQESYYRMSRTEGLKQIKNPRAFLFRTAVNLVNDYHRRSYRRSAKEHIDIASLEMDSPDPSVERVVQGVQELAIVRGALRELAPKCLAVFTLYKFEGRSHKQIAAELNLSVSMVEKYIMQALKLFRQRIEEAAGPSLKLVRSNTDWPEEPAQPRVEDSPGLERNGDGKP